ncbi:hypothetical protein SS50377_25159 [Spironucleus salmonicida]|uniref:Uncharacterized protein n=1 Tax=Spironucleus salmonicida TaxID=348837 RepID=A0A9P8LRP4_9EUKA|nr:hypothetical protein SS50377_25159 [Spironucleus salmonicida]
MNASEITILLLASQFSCCRQSNATKYIVQAYFVQNPQNSPVFHTQLKFALRSLIDSNFYAQTQIYQQSKPRIPTNAILRYLAMNKIDSITNYSYCSNINQMPQQRTQLFTARNPQQFRITFLITTPETKTEFCTIDYITQNQLIFHSQTVFFSIFFALAPETKLESPNSVNFRPSETNFPDCKTRNQVPKSKHVQNAM